jgi:hypothetical protein
LNLFYLFLGVTIQEHVLVMSYRAGSLSYPGRLVAECGGAKCYLGIPQQKCCYRLFMI